MSPASITTCDVCGGGWARQGRGWDCPEGHEHNVCGVCMWEWSLLKRGHDPGRLLEACPDTVRMAKELME